jgi:hypothetical protein
MENVISTLSNVSFQFTEPLVSEWKVEDVKNWIQKTLPPHPRFDLPKIFEENDISGEKLLPLTEQDLINMKVESLGVRKDILSAISNLKQGNSHVQIHNFVGTESKKREREEQEEYNKMRKTTSDEELKDLLRDRLREKAEVYTLPIHFIRFLIHLEKTFHLKDEDPLQKKSSKIYAKSSTII